LMEGRIAKMRWRNVCGPIIVLICSASFAEAAGDPLVKLGADQLCVTEGGVSAGPGDALSVTTPAMRAVVPGSSRQDVEARFAFLGPTDQTMALGSGAIREQFGLKLRAADPCNLVYAMWRFAPTPGVVVQLKSNPGQHTSQACHNNGYREIKPSSARPVAAPTLGRTYRLRAEMEASTLKITVDGSVVWQGDLGSDAPGAGSVGMRSDNAKLSLTLFAPLGSAPSGGPPPHCVQGVGD
jgi:hypothetical protein